MRTKDLFENPWGSSKVSNDCVLWWKGLIGGALCSFSINRGPIPINKNLWSVSYVMVTSSMAFFTLTILYVFIDALAWWSGAPLRYAGKFVLLLVWICWKLSYSSGFLPCLVFFLFNFFFSQPQRKLTKRVISFFSINFWKFWCFYFCSSWKMMFLALLSAEIISMNRCIWPKNIHYSNVLSNFSKPTTNNSSLLRHFFL